MDEGSKIQKEPCLNGQSAAAGVRHTMVLERTPVQILLLVAKIKDLDFVLSTMKGGSTLWSGAGARLPVPQSPHLYTGHTGKHLYGRAVVRI